MEKYIGSIVLIVIGAWIYSYGRKNHIKGEGSGTGPTLIMGLGGIIALTGVVIAVSKARNK